MIVRHEIAGVRECTGESKHSAWCYRDTSHVRTPGDIFNDACRLLFLVPEHQMKVLLKDIDSHYYKTESVRHEAKIVTVWKSLECVPNKFLFFENTVCLDFLVVFFKVVLCITFTASNSTFKILWLRGESLYCLNLVFTQHFRLNVRVHGLSKKAVSLSR